MLKQDKIIINSSFEICGTTYGRIIYSNFGITNDPINKVIKEEGIQTHALTGVITKNTGFFYDVVPNAKVVALKKGVVYDFDVTGKDGSYFLYLENGIYDIRIEGQTYNRVIKNYEVTNGIKEYRNIVLDGQIKKKHLDVVQFSTFNDEGYVEIDNGERLVVGTIVDEHGNPIEGAEIIVGKVDENNSSRLVEAFIKTKKDGKYCFSISRENYDIIVRSPKHHAKVLKNHLFIPDNGFMPQIIESSLMFRKGGEWLWISN
ncbi:hypothetical protein D3C81_893720 [compost metagenome]